jgi:hypothetical protein
MESGDKMHQRLFESDRYSNDYLPVSPTNRNATARLSNSSYGAYSYLNYANDYLGIKTQYGTNGVRLGAKEDTLTCPGVDQSKLRAVYDDPGVMAADGSVISVTRTAFDFGWTAFPGEGLTLPVREYYVFVGKAGWCDDQYWYEPPSVGKNSSNPASCPFLR